MDLGLTSVPPGGTETRFQILDLVNLGVILMPDKGVLDFQFWLNFLIDPYNFDYQTSSQWHHKKE